MNEHDIELRLVDPEKNRHRLYGLTECRTLFGEICLRIVWGRIGNKRLRERDEIFGSNDALEQRRRELLGRRRRHGYVPVRARRGDAVIAVGTERATFTVQAPPPPPAGAEALRSPVSERQRAVAREIAEAHGLPVGDPIVRELVARWHAATREIALYLEERRPEAFDLVDVSTLAALYVDATAAA